MTRALWRIAADTPSFVAHDLSGRGAEQSGGRWNRPGLPLVYASTTIALAALETIVHLGAGRLPMNRFLVRIDVRPKVWAARETQTARSLPVGWSAVPEGMVSLDAGDAWLKARRSALLVVPSVVVPEEDNVLINPAHPDARLLRARKVRPWSYDARLHRAR